MFHKIFLLCCSCGLWMLMQCVVFYKIFPLCCACGLWMLMQCVVFYKIFPLCCACGLWMLMQCVVFHKIFPVFYDWLKLNYNPCKIKFLSSSSSSLLSFQQRLCDRLSLCCVWNCEPDVCWWFDGLLSSVWFKIAPACPEVTPCSWRQEPTPSDLCAT